MNREQDGQARCARGGVQWLNPAARAALIGALVACLLAAVGMSASRTSAPAATAPAPTAAAATVGPLSISGAELAQLTTQAMADYRSRSNADIPAELRPTVKRQMLERLIQRALLLLESKRQDLVVSDQEAEAAVRRDPFFTENGSFNEAKYLAVKNGDPDRFRTALEVAKAGIATRRLTERAIAGGRPDEATIRARAARGLERASFDYLALRRAAFDGSFAEPREAEILAYYRAHAQEFRRPDRAVLSILWVQQDPGPGALRTPQALAAWEQGLRRRADSLLKAVQDGTRLEEAAKTFGGFKNNVVVLPGDFPANWRGDERQSASVFEQKPGSVLPEVVPSNPGWLLVRVDAAERAHAAHIAEAAREIRTRLRQDRHEHARERELRALYTERLDNLRGTGYRVRYAAIDTGTARPGEPSAADLDRFYRGHLADYSSFNSQTGSIESQPFAEVRDNVRSRWIAERQAEMMRARAGRIADLWTRGQREGRTELTGGGVVVRDVGPVPIGVPVDSGAAAAVVTDSLKARAGALGVGSARYASGAVVFHVYARVASFTPTFEQARSTLVAWQEARQAELDEQGARAMFDRDPTQFATGRTLHWTSLVCPIPDFLTVTMTHREVEEYQRRHLDRYSAPELVHASHILISPANASPGADARARARADSLLERLRNGENFARLARQYTDDEATRDQGGDLGEFGRGTMLPEFERAAFMMRAGEISGLVKTEVGYHIILCHEYLPAFVQPLVQMYSNVSSDLAQEKADSLSMRRADSLWRVVRTPAQARAAAQKLHITPTRYSRAIGMAAAPNTPFEAYIRKLETLKPGQMYPGVYRERGAGSMLSWVDSITAPQAPIWEAARTFALDRYRRGASMRAIDAKRAELDSMMAAGWSYDSLATLWGGLEHAVDANLSTVISTLGRRDLDTLVFGSRAPARLKIGEVSNWIEFPAGLARLRVLERAEPNPAQLAARMDSERRLAEARVLQGYFDGLKKRFSVRILDPEMRAVELPPVPEESPS